MKVYVVMHDFGVPYESGTALFGVYSTNKKAEEAIEKQKENDPFDCWEINYYYIVEEELK